MAEIALDVLKEAIKAVNDTGAIDPKIKIVGVKEADLITTFTETVEAMEAEELDIPDEAIEAYNTIYAEEEEKEPEPAQKKKPTQKKKPAAKKVTPKKKSAPSKKPAAKKKPAVVKKTATAKKAATKKEPTAAKSKVKRDDFGFAIGSQGNLFCKAINNKTGKTMKEIKELEWNERGATFYDFFKRLVEKDIAEKDEKTGKMKIKK